MVGKRELHKADDLNILIDKMGDSSTGAPRSNSRRYPSAEHLHDKTFGYIDRILTAELNNTVGIAKEVQRLMKKGPELLEEWLRTCVNEERKAAMRDIAEDEESWIHIVGIPETRQQKN